MELLMSLLFIMILLPVCDLAIIKQSAESLLDGVEVRQDINEHTQEFNTPELIKVNDNIYVGVGYGIANSIFVLAPEGVIVIDTMESGTAAKAILTAFRKVFPKPQIKAIIYTHNHGDHNEGTPVYVDDSVTPPEIWAHHTLAEQMKPHTTVGSALFVRAARQFGFPLPKEKPYFLNNGLGYMMVGDPGGKKGPKTRLVWPTRFVVDEEVDVNIAGLDLKLVHIPGETPDHIGVYIPSMEAFMCGDNLYKTFPNLYAIRGTTLRDPVSWVESLDKIRRLEPMYLVPSHTKPIIGKDNVMDIVTMYRDGIQLVHDQTLRLMHKGYHRDEIGRKIEFPPQQKNNRYLREHYGTIEWSSKAVFNKYIGWFSGAAEEMSALTPHQQAERVIKMAGSIQKVLDKASDALLNKDHQWALELATYVKHVDKTNELAVSIRRGAMKALAGQQVSPNGRNYYLTSVLEDAHSATIKSPAVARNFALMIPLQQLFRVLSFGVKVEECGTHNIRILYNFTDMHETYLLHLRNSILVAKAISPLDSKVNKHNDCTMSVTSSLFREVLGQIQPNNAFINALKKTKNTCNQELLLKFLDCFELPSPDYDFGFNSQ